MVSVLPVHITSHIIYWFTVVASVYSWYIFYSNQVPSSQMTIGREGYKAQHSKCQWERRGYHIQFITGRKSSIPSLHWRTPTSSILGMGAKMQNKTQFIRKKSNTCIVFHSKARQNRPQFIMKKKNKNELLQIKAKHCKSKESTADQKEAKQTKFIIQNQNEALQTETGK